MPQYEYRCSECGNVIEIIQSIKDIPLIHCSQCNQPTLSRILFAPMLDFQGGGWTPKGF